LKIVFSKSGPAQHFEKTAFSAGAPVVRRCRACAAQTAILRIGTQVTNRLQVKDMQNPHKVMHIGWPLGPG
jgi:hypothetical protein